MYQQRFYQNWVKEKDLVSFKVVVEETDLFVRAQKNLQKKVYKSIIKYRKMIEDYISKNPGFLTTLTPFKDDGKAPLIVQDMIKAGKIAGVGPMAAVAGAMAEFVGKDLLEYSDEVIVENGGDIFIKILKNRYIGIYAGNSPYTNKMAIEVSPGQTPLGVCTSSGTVGHSLSFGKADAVTVISKSTSVADAFATAVGNTVQNESDIQKSMEFAKKNKEIKGIIIIKGKGLGIWGDVKLAEPQKDYH